jgi:hypothetical protein
MDSGVAQASEIATRPIVTRHASFAGRAGGLVLVGAARAVATLRSPESAVTVEQLDASCWPIAHGAAQLWQAVAPCIGWNEVPAVQDMHAVARPAWPWYWPAEQGMHARPVTASQVPLKNVPAEHVAAEQSRQAVEPTEG